MSAVIVSSPCVNNSIGEDDIINNMCAEIQFTYSVAISNYLYCVQPCYIMTLYSQMPINYLPTTVSAIKYTYMRYYYFIGPKTGLHSYLTLRPRSSSFSDRRISLVREFILSHSCRATKM